MPKRVGAVPVFPVSKSKPQDPELPVCGVNDLCLLRRQQDLDALGVKPFGQHGAKVSGSSIYSNKTSSVNTHLDMFH